MAAVYENWERLVTATLSREELRQIAFRTPSDLSLVSTGSSAPSFNLRLTYGQASSFLVGDSFTYLQILKATDCLNHSNLIKRGHSGDLYFGVLESGTKVVVKKVHVSSVDKALCFFSEMEICGMVRHSRVIPLLGFCLEDANERFLVYKYMPNIDLSRFLNGRNDDNRQEISLDWTTRLKIAIGAVEGLCYLHHECSPPLVHRDIQASSILLDDKFAVQLGSLAGVCIEEKESNKNRISRFLRSPKGFKRSSSGASGATCAYDVYCFGKVLLELVTGKLGSPPGNDSPRKDWLASTLRHIVPDDKKLIVNIVDSSLIMDEQLLVEAWAVAFIAKACLSRNRSKRPQMAEIFMALVNLARLSGGEHQLTGHPSLVASTPAIKRVPERTRSIGHTTLTIKSDDISGGSTVSRLKFDKMRIRRLLEYSVMKPQQYSSTDIKRITNCFKDQLGEGDFGSVFKGKVSNEVFVAVKILKYSAITADIFINEVATLGMIQHANVVRLLGFCADGFDRALVYEFLPNVSLDKLIFQEGQEHHKLGVERLQNIAVGIARGIEYLHQGCEKRILHLDIKPHNILLDNNYNPKISDFWIATLCGKEISAVSLTEVRGTPGNIAPEVISRKFGVSHKSGIYGFGMLLLEMVGRRRILDVNVQDNSEFFLPEWIYGRLINGERLRLLVEEDGEGEILKKLAIVGLWCIQWNPDDRPSITDVLQMLEGSGEDLSLPPNPFSSFQESTEYLSESD